MAKLSIKKTPLKSDICPFCDDNGILKRVLKTFTHKGKLLIWWSYECQKCGESFTTDKSDSLSMRLNGLQKTHTYLRGDNIY